MKKRVLFSYCLVPFLFAACSDSAQESASSDFSQSQLAQKTRNFGDKSIETYVSPVPSQNFGTDVVTGNFRNFSNDLLISQAPLALDKGRIFGIWNSGKGLKTQDSMFELTRAEDEFDSFGYRMVTGDFCKGMHTSKRKGDILIASMPTAGENMSGGVSIWGWNKSWSNIKELKSPNPLELAGVAIAVGDVDNNGTEDLVYTSMPLDDEWNYLPGRVSVMFNLCNKYGSLNANASVTSPVEGTNFGSSVYVKDLNGNGDSEIIVVDNMFSVGATLNGAIYFYHIVDGKLVESRPRIIGEENAAIESVAFSDIDRDGDLDLIVGEPMYQTTKKREGRVRTYTNQGEGLAFDVETPAWTAFSGQTNSRFGSSVTVEDINQDGIDDLIVGAPGYRTESGVTGNYAYVYVYMGTKDGSIFSSTPYWSYKSNVAPTINDDFGRNIVFSQLNNSGWLDMIVTAPTTSTSTTQIDDLGRVDVFYAKSDSCYTADKCSIDGECFDAGALAKGSSCMMCDPTRANFAWSEVICEDSGNTCTENACIEGAGCQEIPKAEGETCADSLCESNSLTSFACHEGACIPTKTSCENYRCSSETLACMLACTSDSDCYIGNCMEGVCEIPTEGRPVIVLKDYAESVVAGSTFTLDASDTYDPDGGEIWLSWWSSDVDWDLVSSDSTSIIEITAPDTVGKFSMHVLATDDEGLTTQKDLVFNATEPPVIAAMRVLSPAQNANIQNDDMMVSGQTVANAPVSVLLRSAMGDTWTASCSTVSDSEGAWQCKLDSGETILPAGDYIITATTDVNGVPVSYDVNVHLSEALATDENGMLNGGACSISSPVHGFGWMVLLSGLMLGLVPLRRRKNA